MSESATARPKVGLIDCLGLRWFFRLLSSSIGRKFVMGLTGLLLCGFLVAHLAGNLKLFAGAKAFNEYAHFLHSLELLPVAEAGLLLLFLAHIYLAFVTAAGNTTARTNDYSMKQSKQSRRLLAFSTSNWMFGSGAVVLGFIVLHLIDIKFAMRPDIEYLSEHKLAAPFENLDEQRFAVPFKNTVAVLSNPISQIFYVIGAIVLGFHLSHGFASAFQSLGLNHPKYTPLIKAVGCLFALVIALGFASLPVLIPYMQK